MIYSIRRIVGTRLFYWGLKIMPPGIRAGINTMIGIGYTAIDADPAVLKKILDEANGAPPGATLSPRL